MDCFSLGTGRWFWPTLVRSQYRYHRTTTLVPPLCNDRQTAHFSHSAKLHPRESTTGITDVRPWFERL
ncbi:hypothetical protein JTE90_020664 [Oedothorax gibbosus]|uniref:Uncharacterized protein n=1 Tax=Oedothorax gibbosus TaxID=931172 RepID=A0AAV6UUQ4_9ARAC|nr:hypothetical protein JTE90_020664 [Oedothorax gibbosus]